MSSLNANIHKICACKRCAETERIIALGDAQATILMKTSFPQWWSPDLQETARGLLLDFEWSFGEKVVWLEQLSELILTSPWRADAKRLADEMIRERIQIAIESAEAMIDWQFDSLESLQRILENLKSPSGASSPAAVVDKQKLN